jgi:hypothetical protein
MDEHRVAIWSDRRCLLLLFVLTVALRLWQIYNTEVATRDSIAFIRAAWRLEHEPWGEVIRKEAHHPGYSVAIWAISRPVRAFADDLPYAMQLSAQFASALASLFLILPLFFLGKELFDRRVAFWATILFQVLPSSGRLMPDGISEPLFLLWVACALYAAARALKNGSPVWFALVGLCTGLAYLTRTEGLLIVPAMLAVLLALQRSQRWRRTWLVLVRDTVVVGAACALVVVPFMLHIGGLSLKASYREMRTNDGEQMPARPAVVTSRARVVDAPLPLALWRIGPDVQPNDRVGWAAWAVLITVNKGLFHVLSLPTLLGLWLFRRRFAEAPGLGVLLVLALGLLPLLWMLGRSSGYISERHVMMIVLGGIYFAVATIVLFADWLGRGRHAWLSSAMLLVVGGLCLPKTLGRLHGNRGGFREAGAWLAAHTRPGDEVYDPLAWTSFYSGRMFASPDAPRSEPRVCYVVIERSKNDHPHLWYLLDLAEDLIKRGELVHRIPVRRGRASAEIVIYRAPRPPSSDPAGWHLDVWLAATARR